MEKWKVIWKFGAFSMGLKKRAYKTANDLITSPSNSSTNELCLKTYKESGVGKHTLSSA